MENRNRRFNSNKKNFGPRPVRDFRDEERPSDTPQEPEFRLVDGRVQQAPKERFLEVGTIYKVEFTGYTHEGLGIAKIDTMDRKGNEYTNFPLFVFGAIPGEQGLVQVDRLNKTYGYASLVKLFKEGRSENRVSPICSLYSKCGGCNIMHLNYVGQLDFKQKMIEETMKKVGGFENIKVEPIIKMDGKPLYYRNKVQVPVSANHGKTTCGFFQRETHNIIPLETCYIQTEESTEMVRFVKNVFCECGAVGYNEKERSGNFKHILIRKNSDNSEFMIVVVVRDEDFISKEQLDKAILKITKRYPKVESIMLNVNPAYNNTILGPDTLKVYGKDYITDTLCGLKFKIGATSFYQVNHDQCEKLYKIAIEKAKLTNNEVIIDAYCGIGTIGLIASKHAKKLYGVEIVPEAIKNAKANTKLNKIENCEFICAPAEKQIISWMKEEVKPSVIFVDPPRKGCDEKFLETISKMNIQKIVYVSCDPATLARDMKYLVEHGYTFDSVQPVDMFPQTNHVETVVCLERK